MTWDGMNDVTSSAMGLTLPDPDSAIATPISVKHNDRVVYVYGDGMKPVMLEPGETARFEPQPYRGWRGYLRHLFHRQTWRWVRVA